MFPLPMGQQSTQQALHIEGLGHQEQNFMWNLQCEVYNIGGSKENTVATSSYKIGSNDKHDKGFYKTGAAFKYLK